MSAISALSSFSFQDSGECLEYVLRDEAGAGVHGMGMFAAVSCKEAKSASVRP